jgi:hypothetical protein
MPYTVDQLIKKLKELPKKSIINLHDVGTDETFTSIFDIVEDAENKTVIIKFNADVDDETDDDDDE